MYIHVYPPPRLRESVWGPFIPGAWYLVPGAWQVQVQYTVYSTVFSIILREGGASRAVPGRPA